MKSRKERRVEAKLNKVKFEPVYNGESPISQEEYKKRNEKFKKKLEKTIEEALAKEDLEEV